MATARAPPAFRRSRSACGCTRPRHSSRYGESTRRAGGKHQLGWGFFLMLPLPLPPPSRSWSGRCCVSWRFHTFRRRLHVGAPSDRSWSTPTASSRCVFVCPWELPQNRCHTCVFHTYPCQVVCRFLKTPTPVPHLYFHTYFECLQVPFLEDPNTGVCMFESKAIIEYLEKTYGGGAAQ